jgi:SAM-dependent methyltransferase/uncharacterized protein YbaR (Trm112 family)
MNALHQSLFGSLRCPACAGLLSSTSEQGLSCQGCGAKYPVVRGVPVLIDEAKSMFRIDECIATFHVPQEEQPRKRTLKDLARDALSAMTPTVGANLAGKESLQLVADRLREESPAARVLVLGGGSLGVGMDALVNEPGFALAESDVVFGPRANLICDAHNVPFADGTFDAVVAQAVFEYAADPFRMADEIHRVLRPNGFVYAESPFMQQVHGGAYDFFRFTHVGHRRLFRRFEEERSGIVCGPGMALSWSYRYFLRSLINEGKARALVNMVANLTSFWVSRFDKHLEHNVGAFDAASAFYFLGRRSDKTLTDREILASYRGAWKLSAGRALEPERSRG